MNRVLHLLPSLVLGSTLLAAMARSPQDKPDKTSGQSVDDGGPARTVMVNGLPEPVYHVGKGITPPRPTYSPQPEYSEEARRRKVQGTVVLAIVVTSAGDVAQIRVTHGRGYGLDEKAIEAVREWKFRPAMKDGAPVSVDVAVEVSFHLYQRR